MPSYSKLCVQCKKSFDCKKLDRLFCSECRLARRSSNKKSARQKKLAHYRMMDKIHAHNRRARGGNFHLRRDRLEEIIKENSECVYCGSRDRLTIDHMIPVKRGGNNEITNLVPACLACNSGKKDLMPLNFICKLLRR